jgi:hypothetical protein
MSAILRPPRPQTAAHSHLQVPAEGRPEQCAAAILHQLELGADNVVLHAATPAALAPVRPAHWTVRPSHGSAWPANPGRCDS